jgi:hypothetical protein
MKSSETLRENHEQLTRHTSPYLFQISSICNAELFLPSFYHTHTHTESTPLIKAYHKMIRTWELTKIVMVCRPSG